MTPRRSTLYLISTAGLVVALGALLLYSAQVVNSATGSMARKTGIVRRLELTDLCLFTEASYTRHPSMTDPAAPFQDAPLSFEHFPSGALVGPPPNLVSTHVYRP